MPASRPERGAAARSDIAACRAMLRGGSRSFFAASFLLPRRVREPASALYSFCRLADDAVDLEGAGPETLERLRERLARAYDGTPLPIAADRALADVVARFAIPRAIPEALLEGLAWDAAGRRYEDLPDLYAYAARVAGTVGAMMALVMETRSPEAIARASDLGVAMQLTNIARDVGEDARMGRVYLPLRWLREAGIDPDGWLARPSFGEPLGAVILRLLEAADALYGRAVAGIAHLPPACRPGVEAARVLYAEIGNELRRTGLDSVSRRVVVSPRRKLRLLAQAVAASALAELRSPVMALNETKFLVEAVAASPAAIQSVVGHNEPMGVAGRMLWVIDLFEQLERRTTFDREAQRSAV